MPIIDVYSVFQILGLLVAFALIRAQRGNLADYTAHILALWVMVFYFCVSMAAQDITGLYNPAFADAIITIVVMGMLGFVGRQYKALWVYPALALFMLIQVSHITFFYVKRVYGLPEWQMTYQHFGAALFYLILVWIVAHDKGARHEFFKSRRRDGRDKHADTDRAWRPLR